MREGAFIGEGCLIELKRRSGGVNQVRGLYLKVVMVFDILADVD